jgi:hypothetical protein
MSLFRTSRTRSGASGQAASARVPGGTRWMSRVGRGSVLPLALLLGTFGLIYAAPAFAGDATSGQGSMSVSPASAVAGSTGNTFTFTFTAQSGKDFSSGSVVTLVVPAIWTQPTTTAGTAGFTTVTTPAGSTCAASISSIAGTGPWTITVDQTCKGGDGFSLTYGAGTNPAHVTAPATPQASPFTAASRWGSSGAPVNLSTSPQVTVTIGAASRLAFTTAAPGTGTSGSPLSTFRVTVQDSNGNTVTSGNGSTDTIALSIASGPPGGAFTAGAVTSVAAVAGVATFSGVALTGVGTYTLTASDATRGGITTATTGSIVISVPAGSKLAFVQGPSSASAGSAISPAVTVQVQDSSGNAVAATGVSVTLAVSAGVINSGATATTNSAGRATFSGVVVNAAATGLTLTASAGGLTSSPASGVFNVTVAVSNGAALTGAVNDGTGSGVKTVSYYYCAGYTGACTSANWALIGSSVTAAGNYPVTWSAQPANGSYRLVIVGTDNVNNVSQASASIPVTVAN